MKKETKVFLKNFGLPRLKIHVLEFPSILDDLTQATSPNISVVKSKYTFTSDYTIAYTYKQNQVALEDADIVLIPFYEDEILFSNQNYLKGMIAADTISHYVNSIRKRMKEEVLFVFTATWDHGGCILRFGP